MKKALAILKKTSSDIAQKKLNREAKDGRVSIKMDGKKAVLVTLHCETDFVAKNEDFINLLDKIADMALEKMSAQGGPASGWKEEVQDMINALIQKTGENIVLGDVYEVSGNVLGNYVHNNKTGVIVTLEGGNTELAKDIAMHVTAMKPEYISQDQIKEDDKKTMREVFEKEIAGADKPADIKKKMLLGKMATYFKERTLLDQIFIKGEDTVGELLQKNKAKIKEVKMSSI